MFTRPAISKQPIQGELTGLEPLGQIERKHIWQKKYLELKQFLEKSCEAHRLVRRAEKSHRLTMAQIPASGTAIDARSTLPLI